MNRPARPLPWTTWLLAIVVPVMLLVLAEIALLVWTSRTLGWWTLLLVLATTVVGVVLLRQEWAKAWRGISASLRTGSLPAGRATDAALVIVGGLMLLLPGFITDVLGLLCLLPVTRPLVRVFLGWTAGKALRAGASRGGGGAPGPVIVDGDVVGEVLPDPLEPPAAPEDPRP